MFKAGSCDYLGSDSVGCQTQAAENIARNPMATSWAHFMATEKWGSIGIHGEKNVGIHSQHLPKLFYQHVLQPYFANIYLLWVQHGATISPSINALTAIATCTVSRADTDGLGITLPVEQNRR